jgi:hypothetical protein
MKPSSEVENLGERFPWVSFLLTALFFLLFAVILCIVYVPGRHVFNVNQERIDERLAILADVNAKSQNLLHNYAWVDQSKGTVRIPIEEGMRCMVKKNITPSSVVRPQE